MDSPTKVILNPRSGGGKGRRVRPELERELAVRGVRTEFRLTEHVGHAVDLARDAARSGARVILAAGGDGTVHEVANGILQARAEAPGEVSTVLGIIPIGTGNDLIKTVTGTTHRRPAYDVIAGGKPRRFDVGVVEWDGGREFFVNAAGTGIDVEVVRQIDRLPRLPGLLSYLIGLLRALTRFRPIPIRIRIDSEEFEESVMMIAVGNGHSLGGGFRFTPDAVPDDGWFDVCMVKKLNLFQVPGVLAGILGGGAHRASPHVVMRRARSIEIFANGEAPLFFQLDGELREPARARSVRVRVEPAALPVLARPDGAPNDADASREGSARVPGGEG